jgi:hypothetical protein
VAFKLLFGQRRHSIKRTFSPLECDRLNAGGSPRHHIFVWEYLEGQRDNVIICLCNAFGVQAMLSVVWGFKIEDFRSTYIPASPTKAHQVSVRLVLKRFETASKADMI